MKKSNQKGITMVALIVTVVILLILATVTITVSLDDDSGVVTKAKEAKNKAESFTTYESIMEAVVTSKKKSGKINFTALEDKIDEISDDAEFSYNNTTNEATITIGNDSYVVSEYGGITEE